MADDLEGRLHGQIQENRDDIDAIRARIDSIKEAGVAMKLKIAQLEKEVDYLQRHIKSRDGLRWNQPDMVDWIRATEDINEGWRGAIPKHQNIR